MPYLVYCLTLGLVIGVVLLFNGNWFTGAFVLLFIVMLTRRLVRRGGSNGVTRSSD